MPYDNLSDLPDQVKNSLSKHTQEIYIAAYNNAWDQYKDPDDRQDGDTREETSHKIA